MCDPRDPEAIEYTLRHLLWGGILMYLLHMQSRNQFRWDRLDGLFARNLATLAGSDEETAAHPDTLAAVLRRMDCAELEKLLALLLRRLIRMKALDGYRVRSHFLVAVDGTHYHTFDQRHCDHCIEVKHSSGTVTYQHPVLIAFLVTGNGLALPLAVEFIENPPQPYDKQDCEKKAFYRLAKRLKALYPQTPFCLLFDALYADRNVMRTCHLKDWKYFITFKPTDMPALWDEAIRLRDLSPQNHRLLRYRKPTQRRLHLRWVNDLDHGGQTVHALFQDDTTNGNTLHFAHLTNFHLRSDNAECSATGARQRWRIENEGFNVLKNGGFDLQHVYSRNFHVAKAYFYLMLIAHLIQQLLVRGSLFVAFRVQLGTWRNHAKRLSASLCYQWIPPNTPLPGQIRLRSP
jgi:hypothetical protein